MASNDLVVLNSVLQAHKSKSTGSLSDDDHFRVFAFEQVLKQYELSNEELEDGSVAGVNDGGIDGLFTFVDQEYVVDEDSVDIRRRNPSIEVYLIQVKRNPSFTETALDHVIATLENLFDFRREESELRELYNPGLLEKARLFRSTYVRLAPLFPVLDVYFVYISTGDAATVHAKVRHKGDTVRRVVDRLFSGCRADVRFVGAKELLDLYRQEPSRTLALQFLENYISRAEDSYVVLVRLLDYFRFITDNDGKLRHYIFESNVRDYLGGDVEVNADIQRTLVDRGHDHLDFWWMNNGITILASEASVTGKTMNLRDAQVVNGLQTSRVIFNHFSSKDADLAGEDRAVLLRVVVTREPEARDKIIKATNYQTAMPAASLRATDRIQRDIEDYFRNHDLCYERRRNYYKNAGVPADKILSIPYLAQATMAMLLRQPDSSRARPSSLIKSEPDYERVFDPGLPMECFLFCAQTMKQVDAFVRTDSPFLPLECRRNLRFHLAMLIVIRLLGRRDYRPRDVQSITGTPMTPRLLNECLQQLSTLLDDYPDAKTLPIDRVAKSREFVSYLLNAC